MATLHDVIRALRAELSAALDTGAPLPEGCRLEPGKVVVTLGFSVLGTEDGGTPRFVVSSGRESAHAVQVEFAVAGAHDAGGRPAGQEAVVAPAPVLRGGEAERVVGILSGVFGEPGFDSSARATVFREALESLDAAGMRRLVSTLGDPGATGDRELDRARHLVRRVIASGPGGVEAGVAALAGLFGRHDPMALVELVADRWRDQDAWLE